MFNAAVKKYYRPALAGAFALLILLSVLVFFVVPKIAGNKILYTLKQAGFQTSYIKPPQTAYGAILYKDVAFDADAFSTARYIKVTYNPLALLFLGRIDTLDVIGLNLTGNWDNNDYGSLSFAGWLPPAAIGPIPLTIFKHINFSDSQLSLLTQTAGGISVFFDAASTRTGSKLEFQSSLKSRQKYLSFVANATGAVENGRWFSDIEIADGKFEDPAGDYWGSRMNGWLNISAGDNGSFKIMSQMRAGGLNLYGLPWQNASSTIDYTDGNLKCFTEAKSIGHDDGLELELNILGNAGAPLAIGGTVHADNPQMLIDYFTGRPEYAGFVKDLQAFKQSGGLDADFLLEQKGTSPALRYEIKENDGSNSPGKIGELILKP